MTHSETERLRMVREYFESGCACIAAGKLALQPASIKDSNAIAFYQANCSCSRNTK